MRLSRGPARLLGAAHLFPASRVNREREREGEETRDVLVSVFRYSVLHSLWMGLHLSTHAEDAEQTTFCGFPTTSSYHYRVVKRQRKTVYHARCIS
jgi:hypothetical protein